MFKLIIAGAFAVSLGMTATAKADSNTSRQYHVLRLADYEAITRCSGSDYERSLQSAVKYLAFAGLTLGELNNDLQYARRHTLPLFRSLQNSHAGPEGYVEERCIPPSLRQIGFGLKLLDTKGRFADTSIPEPDFVYDPSLLKPGAINSRAFPVMTRLDYFAATRCKTSKKNYRRYREAFYWVVLAQGYQDKARAAMSKFLDVLYAWQPTNDGFVDQQCLIPAISLIASDLGLLDEKGGYRAR